MAASVGIPARQRNNLILEDTAGVYNGLNANTFLSCLKADYQEHVDRVHHRDEGENASGYSANQRRWVTLSGPFQPEFYHLDWLLRLGFDLTEETIVGGPRDGGRRIIATLPNEGMVTRKTATLEHGTRTSCRRSTYLLMSDFTLASKRGGTTDGTISLMARSPEAKDVPMTGGVADNAQFRLTAAAGTSAAIGLAIAVDGGGTENVSLNPWSDEASMEALLAALNGIGAAEVTKNLTEQGKAWSFIVNNPGATQFQVNDCTPFIAGTVLNTIRDRIRNTGAPFAACTVTGTSAAPITLVPTVLASDDVTNPNNTLDNNANTSATLDHSVNGSSSITYDLGQLVPLQSVTLNIGDLGAVDNYLNLWASPNSDFSGQVSWGITNTENASQTINAPNQTAVRYFKVATHSGGANILKEISWVPTNSQGVMNIVIAVPATVGNPNTPEIAGAGAAINVSTPYSAVGTVDIEITDPASTPVSLTKTGGAGWTVAPTTTGRTGNEGRLPKAPITPDMWRVWRTDTLPAVGANPDDGDLIPQVQQHAHKFAGLVDAAWFEDGDISYNAHRDGVATDKGYDISMTVTAANATTGTIAAMIDEAQEPEDGDGNPTNVVAGHWFHTEAAMGKCRFVISLYGAVVDNIPYSDNDGVYANEFPIGAEIPPDETFFVRCVLELPAAA